MIKKIEVKEIKKYTPQMAAAVEYHMELLMPGARRRGTQERFKNLLKNPNAILLGAFDEHDALLGIVTLYKIETLGRKTVLFEECVVDSRFRDMGVGQALTRAAIDYVVKRPELGDRIEGTVNEKHIPAWNCYMKGGMHDRHNKAFFWVRVWD